MSQFVTKFIFIAFLLISSNGFAQKAKKPVPKKNVVIGSYENATAVLVPLNKGSQLVLFVKNETSTDTLVLKKSENTNFSPANFNCKQVSVSGVTLFHVSWEELILVDTKLKKESTLFTENQLWNVISKKQVFSNVHKKYHLKETQFLDKNKTASHDVEKKSTEGQEFFLLPNGNVSLYSNSSQLLYEYISASDSFEIKKTPEPAVSKSQPKPKPKRK